MFRPCLVLVASLVLAAILAAAAAPCAAIAAQKSGDLPAQAAISAPVPNGGGRTFADLTALAFPGVKSELEIRRAAERADPDKVFNEPVYLPQRRVADAIAPLRPLAARFKMPEKMPARYFLDGVKFVRVTGDGKPMLAVLFGGNNDGVGVLALFEASPQSRLLDLVNVRSDRFTTLLQRPVLRLGPAASAFVLVNSHDSHTVAYEEDTLVYVLGGRFVEIGGFSMNQSHLGDISELRETAALRVLPGADPAHARIEATVTTITRDAPEGSRPAARKRAATISMARGVWRWDAATQAWKGQPSALGKLGDWQEGSE